MSLQEAIEMLYRIVAQDEESGRPDCVIAEKLGIEALKRLAELRRSRVHMPSWRLPGETEPKS